MMCSEQGLGIGSCCCLYHLPELGDHRGCSPPTVVMGGVAKEQGWGQRPVFPAPRPIPGLSPKAAPAILLSAPHLSRIFKMKAAGEGN